jgi:hypothetical protein
MISGIKTVKLLQLIEQKAKTFKDVFNDARHCRL